MTRLGSRTEWLVMGAFVTVWLLFDLVWFQEAFIFHGDHERDLRYATLFVSQGIFPDSTPSISPLPFELGPLLYFVLAPAVAISPDPVFVRAWFALLTAGAFVLLFVTWRRHVRWEAAAFALFLLGASTFTYELSRQLWHSSLLPLPIAGFFWAASQLLGEGEEPRPRDAALAAVCAAVTLQLHMSAVTYVAALAAVLLWRARGLGRRGWLAAAVGFGISLLPFILTLARSVADGALEGVSSGGREWSPAGPGVVLGFFVDNVHTIWGDDLGPLLTWPAVGLALWGGWCAIQRRDRFGLLMVGIVAVGLVVESMLLGNQRAHRYMHANLWATFALVAYGLDALLGRVSWRWAPHTMAGLAAVVCIEALVSEVPHTSDDGWLSALEQRAVAQVVAEEYPLDSGAMERRVHGIYFGEPMGMAHLHTLYAAKERTPFSETAHVLVMPDDLGLSPYATAASPAHVVKAGSRRSVRVLSFEPALDHETLSIESPLGEQLRKRWRRPQARRPAGGDGGGVHTLRVRATRAGTVHLMLSDGRSERDRCPVAAWLGQESITPQPIEAQAYRWARFVALPIPRPGRLTVRIGPCRQVAFLDLF